MKLLPILSQQEIQQETNSKHSKQTKFHLIYRTRRVQLVL